MIRLALLLSLLLTTGCQYRETHIAVAQADQATEGAGQVLAEQIAPVAAQLPPEVQEAFRAAVAKVHTLLSSVHTSLQPALVLTAGGEPAPPIPTTVRDAVEHTEDFARTAAMQAGKAQSEVDDALATWDLWSSVLKWGGAIGGDLMSQLLLLIGGGSGAGAAGLAVFRLWQQAKVAKRAVADAVSFGNEAVAIDPKDNESRRKLVEKHKARQAQNGTKTIIKQAGAHVTASLTA